MIGPYLTGPCLSSPYLSSAESEGAVRGQGIAASI